MSTRFRRPLLVMVAIFAGLTIVSWLLVFMFREKPGLDFVKDVLEILANILTVLTSILALSAFVLSVADPTKEAQNRRRMLEKVKAIWVTNYLQDELRRDALAHGAPLARSLLPKPRLVRPPSGRSAPAAPPPHGTPLVKVFDDCGGELLLLGQPGTGKTFALLELARDLIDRAEEKPDEHPVPVIFKLSSWGAKREPLEDWLLKEFKDFYGVDKKIAQPWLESQALTLLLDGLDEVGGEHIGDCVQAIERFREKHGLIGIAVSARSNEYEGQAARLSLSGAVELQPLTPDQIDAYLTEGGLELEALRETLRLDADLFDMARTPLFLSLMARAYRGRSADDLKALSSHDVRREHLFGAYVQRMFEHHAQKAPEHRPRKRRKRGKPFSPEQTRRWLAWLARRMWEHTQITFLIERLQPTWLGTNTQRRLYRIGVGVFGGLFGGLLVGPLYGLFFGLLEGLAGGVLGGVLGGAFGGLLVGLVIGPLGGLVVVLLGRSVSVIKTAGALSWSWRGSAFGLFYGLFVGLLCALLFGLLYGLLYGLFGGLLFGLLTGLQWRQLETPINPNQGIWQLAWFALLTGLLNGMAFGLIFGLQGKIYTRDAPSWSWRGAAAGLLFGLMIGLLFSLAVIQHFTLRAILALSSDLPLRLVRFLEQGVELIFLRRVGGAYEFIHPYLQEYFASLSPQR